MVACPLQQQTGATTVVHQANGSLLKEAQRAVATVAKDKGNHKANLRIFFRSSLLRDFEVCHSS